METVVTAGIVAVVLSATIGVLARYTDTDVRSQKYLRAQHLAQAEVDEVMARHAVENSLVSDDKGRSRYYAIPQPGLGYMVSQYYFHNFPISFPKGNFPFDHGSGGSIDTDDPTAIETLFFDADPWRTTRGAATNVEGDAAYRLRYQLLGIESSIDSDDLHMLINMTSDAPRDAAGNPLTAAQRNGLYNNHFWVPGTANTTSTTPKGANVYNPLIADSSPSVAVSGTWWRENVRRFKTPYDGYSHFVSKVLIVRVYDRQEPRREIGHAYGVLTGRVQL
jgi:hypothetical protein